MRGQLVRSPIHRHRLFILEAVTLYGMTGGELVAMKKAVDLDRLGAIAQGYISRLGESFCTGIGPMTTGNPPRSVDQNFEIFRLTYLAVIRRAGPGPVKVFCQLPFEYHIKRIADESYDREHSGEVFYKDLFDKFYRPVMEHPNLRAVWRMPDWANSTGAKIEFDILESRAVPVVYYDALDYVPEINGLLR